MQVLATIAPLDPATGSRVTLRASSADRREMLALNSVRWVPAIIRRPSISDDLFDGNFTGAINDGGATIDFAMFGLKRQDALAATYRYAGAVVTIYEGDIGDAWPWTTIFTGIVDSFTNDAERLSLRLKVNTAPFGVPVLTATYAGTGGKEGGADLKFKVKPWCFGAASNVEPVLIDVTNIVYQVSAYGPINGVTACYERAASFGASYGNYTTYALLVAASIPPGRWATCLAEGMIRLGAPETGLITADVEGDKPSTFLRKTGEIINRICTNAGISAGSIDSTSLNGLDTALTTLLTGDGYINLYLTEQTTVMEIAQRLARPCNAAAGVHPRTGKLYVCRTAAIGSSVLTLNAQGRKTPTEPGVLACVEQDVSPPYWRIEMQGQRSWRVHGASEIAFTADLVEVGDYAGGTTHREGNIVTDQGGRWLYINPTATAGNAPPTLPTTSNSYWSLLSYPPDYSVIAGTKPPSDATRNVDRGAWSASSVAYVVGDEVQNQSSTWGALTNHTSSGGNGPPTLPTTSNTNWRLRAKAGDAGLDTLNVTASPTAMTVACSPVGAPNAGQLPRTVTIKVRLGGTDITGSCTITSTGSGCTITDSGSSYTVDAIAGDTAKVATAVTYGALAGAVTTQISKTRDGSPAISVQSNFGATGSGSFVSAGELTLAVGVAGSGGTITLDASLDYDVASGFYTAAGKWQYRTTPGSGTYIDVAGAETVGSTADATVGGGGSLFVGDTMTGPTTPTNWEFKFLHRRYSGGTSPFGTGTMQASFAP